MKTATSLLILFLAGPAAAGDDAVRIYLPRTVKVSGEKLQLGTIGVVLCDDAKREARARATALGRTPWPGENIVIDRRTVLSCLAHGGIAADRVRIAGARQVTVTREESTTSAGKLLAVAETFLQQLPARPKNCIYQVLRRPQKLTVSGSKDLDYACRLEPLAAGGQVKVVVTVRREGKQLGFREILYRRMYPVRTAVATRRVPAGAVLTKENLEIQTSYEPKPADKDWKAPYGRLARQRLLPGTAIRPSMTAEKKPDLKIRRNQIVQLRVQGPGFRITGVGQALQEGRVGDVIKVRNVDSKRVITGLVAFDGSVEPVFGR
ncbi:MAG TPA: flagellar basal body P-ring formation chaperone FlgA [Phycisphaerae bacterium]|nr:flagellar basal body P-ring formation chaperone FlgA [Phycisphaerae bacterium]